MLDMPCSPQALVLLWSAKSQGQIACNRPAIFLSSSVSTLDPTAGSKEDYHSPIKKVNLPSPISSASFPSTARYVFISTHLCFCVAFPLNFSFSSFFQLPFVNTVLHGKVKGECPLAYFCLSRHVFFQIVLNGCKVLFFFIASAEQFKLKSAQFLIKLSRFSIKEAEDFRNS